MLLNHLINYYVLKELLCQDMYTKIELKLKHTNSRPVNTANIINFVCTRI